MVDRKWRGWYRKRRGKRNKKIKAKGKETDEVVD